jgi:DNA helicase MCM8
MTGGASPENRGTAPKAFTTQQNEFLLTLWNAHHRPLVHVPLSMEPPHPTRVSEVIPKHAYDFTVRLHQFLYTFLQQAVSDRPRSVSGIKSPRESALRPYVKYATTARIAAPATVLDEGDEEETAPNADRRRELRGLPVAGRRVLPLHQEDFFNEELNPYEMMMQAASSEEEFIRNQSYGAYLYHRPEEALAALGCALPLAIVTLLLEQQNSSHSNDAPPSTITNAMIHQYCNTSQVMVRFLYVQPILPMNDIRTGLVGKLLSVRGHVTKVRPKRLSVATADFACRQCQAIQTHSFYNDDATERGQYSVPRKCWSTNGPCPSKSFTLLRSTARYMDVQEIRIQEIVEDNVQHIAAGRTPRQMDLQLQQADLVDRCRPGDTICVAAVVAAARTGSATGGGPRAKETSSIFQLFLRGHSITTMSSERSSNGSRSNRSSNGDKTQGATSVVYTTQQLRRIVQLCHADHRYFGMTERRAFPFDLLVRSICPAIIGHHAVKVGLLLCLLGGTPTEDSATMTGSKGNAIRSNSHLLIVGDPGMGKSQLLLAATQLAARSVYVGGNTSSTTGLTVTLTKEPGTGETSIEAGALVLADQGICAIDEFDKMTKNHQDGLLEAMEQQQVSIAKAGVVASLPARCSVIAAANPKQGNYNMGQTVAENINMAKPILSRFDLVFILRDHVDQNLDRMVSSTIMNLYRTKTSSNENGQMSNGQDRQNSSSKSPQSSSNQRMPLVERLLWVNEFQKVPLPADLVRDYISYAREYCKPKLTPEAAAVLKDYFMELRYPADGRRRADTVPITTRQLEAMIRLCQARAKACLRDYVLQEDALDVVELMTNSMEQVHATNDLGALDPSRGGAGGQSNRKMKKALINEIQRIIGIGADCSLDDLVRVGSRCSWIPGMVI